MNSYIYIPGSLRAAGRNLRRARGGSLKELAKRDFLRAWCSLVYLFPGLHPDHYLEGRTGWPRRFRKFAAEGWRRFRAGELTANEFYCYQPAVTRLSRECSRLEQLRPWLFSDHFAA